MNNLTLGHCGDEVVLIDFMTPIGESAKTEDIRQIITYGEMGQKYNKDPYTHYEINWNKKHQQVLAYAGCNDFDGLSGNYWLHSGHGNLLEDAAILHLKFLRERWIQSLPVLSQVDCLPISLGRDFEWSLQTESGVVYCQIEDDHYPDELNLVESPHLIWVDSDSFWGGCGSPEGGLSEKELPEKFFPLLDLSGMPSVLAMKEALLKHSYKINAETVLLADSSLNSRIPNFGITGFSRFFYGNEINTDLFEQCDKAIAWLNSLRAGLTKEADLQTVEWIEKWLVHS